MKICICTTPIRPKPTTFPPFGSMAIIQALRSIGEEVTFFNIDYHRFGEDALRGYFKKNKFDVVGISAVVSTAYSYTKFLSKLIKHESPKTIIILGGNLAASAEIILRKTYVDFCVLGDGELIIQELITLLRNKKSTLEEKLSIKGISFLDQNKFYFTGFGIKPTAEEISWPDYSILEEDGSLSYFISDQLDNRMGGTQATVSKGKRLATVIMTKGCVARCTFCHRFEKGFRARPVDQVIEHIKFLINKYNVGFIDIADENFGADRKIAYELAAELGKLNVLWRCAGVRVRTINKDMLQHWKNNGCTSVIFGVESGSERMLKIMEKNATVEENLNAMKWTSEVGLGTIIQLVIGMPGENDQTIQETTDFLIKVSRDLIWWKDRNPSDLISINYAQALPGTPMYEWAREKGFIGSSIEDEEKYLIQISDTDAYKSDHFINYTGLPLLRVLMWPKWINAQLDFAHLPPEKKKKISLVKLIKYYSSFAAHQMEKGWLQGSRLGRFFKFVIRPVQNKAKEKGGFDYISDSGFFNIRKGVKFFPLLLNPITKRFFIPLLVFATAIEKSKNISHGCYLIAEYLIWIIKGRKNNSFKVPNMSLRKVVKISNAEAAIVGDAAMVPLRKGR